MREFLLEVADVYEVSQKTAIQFWFTIMVNLKILRTNSTLQSTIFYKKQICSGNIFEDFGYYTLSKKSIDTELSINGDVLNLVEELSQIHS